MIRALAVLAATFHGPVPPACREQLAGVDALVARPSGGDGPVLVFANAATPRGVEEPFVGRFLGGLASAGFVAVAPELPHVRLGEVTPATVEALVTVTRVAGPRAALVGTSTGAGLALLAAADPLIAHRITGVAAIAPFASLRRILRLATTGFYEDRRFQAASVVANGVVRSLTASAPDDPGIAPLLANRDPRRFDELYAALEPPTRTLVESLSPETRIPCVTAPVELASDPEDRFFPVEESLVLARAGHDVRLTVTPALEHVRPRLRPGLVRVSGVLDRTLRRARKAEGRAAVVRAERAGRLRPDTA